MPPHRAIVTPNFRFKAQKVFLTYPNVTGDVSLYDFEEFFTEKFTSHLTYFTIARELHENGTPHFHCLLLFDKQMDSKNCRYFDYLDYHPNIVTPNDLDATKTYVQKNGDFIEGGEFKSSIGDVFYLINR